MSRNFTQEGQRAGASGEEGLQDPPGRENCSRLLTNSLADIESSLQRDAEAAYTHSEVQPARHSSVSLLLLKPALGCLLPPARDDFLLGWSDPVCVPPTPVCASRRSPAAAGTGCRWKQREAAPSASPLPTGLLVFEVSGG